MKKNILDRQIVKKTYICVIGNLLCLLVADINPLMGFVLFVWFNITDTIMRIISSKYKE